MTILFFFYLLLTLKNLALVHAQCLKDESNLLLELKSQLTFDSSNSKKLLQWNNQSRDCCFWHGVECDGGGRVISLQLDGDFISGGLNDSSSLFRLRHLKKLNLANNDFDATQIPTSIHRLLYLEDLNLSRAGFVGRIPTEVSLMKRLVALDITSSSPQLELPNWKMMVQNLTRLRELYLDGVDISAAGSEWCTPIPSSLPNLRILSLKGCSLSGPFQPLSHLHSLSVLRLDRNNLSTTIPDSFINLTAFNCRDCSLIGSLPKMMLQVPTLQELDVSSNVLLGGNISHHFPLSRALRSIDMSRCSFDGAIPSSFGNLTELVSLDLSFNFFTGSIPLFYVSEKLTFIDLSWNSLKGSISGQHFEGLSNLASLYLQQNLLSGTIPHTLFDLPSLQQLDLSYNKFSGHVREFSMVLTNISTLGYLLLSNNLLEGPIPNSFFQLQSLVLLDLSYNNFNGTFHLEKFEGLSNLEYLYLSYNNLSLDSTDSFHAFPNLYGLGLASCNLTNFPDFIKQSSLDSLDLSNNRIAGDIPSWIWGIGNGSLLRLNLSGNLLEDLQKPFHISASLWRLDLHSNQLRGELPPLPETAEYVDYSSNYFHNPIPPNYFENISSNIYFLSLAKNRLTGAIPTSLCNATLLEVLDLSFNNFSSTIPPCVVESMDQLRVLNLRGNSINGVIPSQFSANCSLKTMDLSFNNLGGKISKSLANCKSLAVLNVGYNKFDDSFPCMLPSSLRVLVLRSNRFNGELGCNKSWPNLQIMDISSNNFNGTLHPLNFSTWRGMVLQGDEHMIKPNHSRSNLLGMWYSFYQDEVALTVKGLEVNLVKIWPEFTSIDLSCNNFHGGIPGAIGDLTSLYLLNLSHNALTSTIPKSLGALTELGSLDLSTNQLNGRIPEELAGLTFLSFLNVSHNELVGTIPKGPQFDTFSTNSFEGNTGLCGFPLNISCTNIDGNGSTPPKEEDDDDDDVEWEYVCAALGYGVGLGIIVWILLFWRRFREGYFDKIEDVAEKILECRDRRKRHQRRKAERKLNETVVRIC